MRHADARVVEQGEQLLAPRAGRRDEGDRTGPAGVGEAEPEPADHRRAAVGPHHQEAALGRHPLERHLLVDRHVVAEEHHVAPGVEGVHGLDEGTRSGHGHQGEGVGGEAQGRAGGARRGDLAGAGRGGPGGEGGGDGGQGGVERVVGGVVGQPDRDHHVVGRRVSRHVEAHLGQHGDVELGRHRDLRGGDTRRLRDLAAHLEERDGVGVRPRAQLDVGPLMRPSPRCPGRAGRPPAGRGPTTHRPRSGPPPRERPRRDSQAANSGSTSPCRAQSSKVAESSVVRRPAARTSSAGVGSPAAYLVASQPQATSSPYGVSPSPRPIPASTSSRRPAVGGGHARHGRVDEPRHVHLGAAEEQRPADEAGLREDRGRRGGGARCAGRSAPARRRSPARRAPMDRGRRSERSGRRACGPRWSTSSGPSGAVASRSCRRGVAAAGRWLMALTLVARLPSTDVHSCQRNP